MISSVEAVADSGDAALGTRRFGEHAPVSVGAVFGLVLGTILLRNWIFRDDLTGIDEDALVAGIVAMVMHGLRGGEPAPFPAMTGRPSPGA